MASKKKRKRLDPNWDIKQFLVANDIRPTDEAVRVYVLAYCEAIDHMAYGIASDTWAKADALIQHMMKGHMPAKQEKGSAREHNAIVASIKGGKPNHAYRKDRRNRPTDAHCCSKLCISTGNVAEAGARTKGECLCTCKGCVHISQKTSGPLIG